MEEISKVFPSAVYSVGRKICSVEREYIERTLAHCRGNKNDAAKMLGVCLKTLYNKLRRYAAEDARRRPCLPQRLNQDLGA